MQKLTIHHALSEWYQSSKRQKISQKATKNVETAFKRYIFPELGLKTLDLTTKEFSNSLEQLNFPTLLKACQRSYNKEVTSLSAQDSALTDQVPVPQENLPAFLMRIFDQQFDAAVATGRLSPESKRNYRPPLGHFLKWVVSQTWWQELFPENMPEIAPLRPKGLKKPTLRSWMGPYALKKEELPEKLIKQLEAYHQFRLDGGEKYWQKIRKETRRLRRSQIGESSTLRQERQVRPKLAKNVESSYETEERVFLQFWGWLVKIERVPLENLELENLLDLSSLEDCGDWKTGERHTGHANLLSLMSGAIGVAKFFNFDKTKRRKWLDVPIIGDLQELKSEHQEHYKEEHTQNCKATWKLQLLTHPELQKLSPYLRQRCAPYSAKISQLTGEVVRGEKQSDASIVWFYQAYLLVKYFVYLPNRLQEPQQYSLGKTLFREVDKQGEDRYFAKQILHKNQRHKGVRDYPLPKILTQDFDNWIKKYRPKVEVALQSEENWLSFWGIQPDELQKLHQRLKSARQGNIPRQVKDKQKYIAELENECESLQNRINFYPTAKANFEGHNSFFFTVGLRRSFQNFGKPLSSGTMRGMVQSSVAAASQSVLNKTRWTSPHRFRHIAENQARNPKVSEMLNHDPEMGIEYRKQISQESEEHLGVVDDWWEEQH